MFSLFDYFKKNIKENDDYLKLCANIQTDSFRLSAIENQISCYENYVILYQNLILNLSKNKNDRLALLAREQIILVNNDIEKKFYLVKQTLEEYKNCWNECKTCDMFGMSIIFDFKIRIEQLKDKLYNVAKQLASITMQLDEMAKDICDE